MMGVILGAIAEGCPALRKAALQICDAPSFPPAVVDEIADAAQFFFGDAVRLV
jgi:hypothetical protein